MVCDLLERCIKGNVSVMLDNVLLRGCNLAATAAGRNTITIGLIWIVPTDILAATSAQKLRASCALCSAQR